jgi:hypothetical protein
VVAATYNDWMNRVAGVSFLVLCGLLAAGCGGSHVQLAALHGGLARPPAWLTRIAVREAKLLDDPHPHPISYTLSKQKDVVDLFGEFRYRSRGCSAGADCPALFGMRGTSLRLLIAPRTHRILSTTLSSRIAGAQAPAIARRSSRFLRIFLPRPGTTACSIPRGGVQTTNATFRGRCTTGFVSYPYSRKAVRVRFGERWRLGGHVHRAAWVVTVRLRDGRVQSTRVTGQPPQLWK